MNGTTNTTNNNISKQRKQRIRAPKTLFALVDNFGIADTSRTKKGLMWPEPGDLIVKYVLAPVVGKTAKKAAVKKTSKKTSKKISSTSAKTGQ